MSDTEQNQISSPHNLVFLFILLFSILLRFYFYMGPSGADDMIYFSVIEKLLLHADVGETITSSMHWGMRTGMIFPIWGIMKIFGVSELSSMIFPMILSAGTLVFIFLAGRDLFNSRVALIAASAYAILPLDVYYSGVMYPDGPVVVFSALFLYILYKLSLNENVDIKRSLLAGLILGIGFYIRETSLLLFVAFPILFFRAPKKGKYITTVFYIIVGLVIAISIEMMVLWLLTGDPLARFHMLAGKTNVFTPNQYKFHPRFHSYFLDGIILLFATHWIAPMMIALMTGIAMLLMSRTGRERLMSLNNRNFLWIFILAFAILLFYIYAPVIGFTKPLERDERYYLILMPFFALLTGFVFNEFISQGGRQRVIGYSLVLFYAFTSLVSYGSIMNKNSLGVELIDKFIKQNEAVSYLIPSHLKPVLHLKNGLQFMQGRIITYNDSVNVSDLIRDIHKDGAVQYVFDIPRIQEIQSGFKEYINWPLETMERVTVMTTSPRFSCSLIRSNTYLYRMVPHFIKSRVCYSADVFVYKLK